MLLPAAVAVQLFGAGHLGRHVPFGQAAFLGLVQRQHALREGIVRRQQPLAARDVAVDPELGALPGVQRQRQVVGLELQLAAPDHRAARVVVPLDAEQPAALRLEAALGAVDLDLLRHLARAHAHGQ